MTDIHASNSHFEKNQMKFSYLNRGTGVEALFFGSSLLFMLNQQTRCQDNILLTQKF
jgi:hypothetical protein